MSLPQPGSNPVHAALAEVEDTLAKAGDIELSILMPCLNEAETLGICIDKAKAFLWRTGINGEVVIADNGSTDGSQGIARAHGARVVQVEARGYGAALIGGIRSARGRFVIMGDSDNSYDFANLDRFVEKLREGYDVVMGNRFRGGIAESAMPRLHRYLGNPVLSFVGRLFFRSAIGDFHCGLRGFSREAVLGLDLDASGMEFASEMVVKATLARLAIEEAPVTLRPDGRSRPPHLRSWRDGWRHLRFMLLFTPRWLFLIPGAVLSLLSLLLFLRLAAGPLEVAGVRFDTNTLLVAGLGLLTGVQMLLFGVLAKLFAVNQGLLPPTAFTGWLRRRRLVELGIGSGGVLALLGLGYLAYEVELWRRAGFGDLSYPESLRIVVPAVMALAVGVQLVFAGFMLALIDLSREIRLRTLDPG